MIGLLALAVPLIGVVSALIFQLPSEPTKPGTSSKPEGGDPRQEKEESNDAHRSRLY